MGGQKFAVLLCAEDSDYVKKIYGGYYGVFVRMLKEEGERWDVFKVARGEFPADDEIGEYDGFVITGSCNDAHGNDLWICRLLMLLKKLDSMKKKVLGICFGHQVLGVQGIPPTRENSYSDLIWSNKSNYIILGRALGGKVGRASAGWDIGITKVHLTPSQIFTTLKMPTSLSVIECHRDELWELPPKAEVLAWSDKTGIEMFRCSDHIMGIQGHPEYTKDILLHLIDRLFNRDLIEESLAKEAKTKLEASEPDREVWKKLCTSFLKGRL